jgi:hypothetical protein
MQNQLHLGLQSMQYIREIRQRVQDQSGATMRNSSFASRIASNIKTSHSLHYLTRFLRNVAMALCSTSIEIFVLFR